MGGPQYPAASLIYFFDSFVYFVGTSLFESAQSNEAVPS